MGGRTVAASGLSLLGYFPLHIVLQEREEGGRKRAMMSDSQSQADESRVA